MTLMESLMNTTISRPILDQISEYPSEIWGELDIVKVRELFSGAETFETWGFACTADALDLTSFNRIKGQYCFLCIEGTPLTTQDQVDALHQMFQNSFDTEVMLHYSVNKIAKRISGYAVYIKKRLKL